ncbi:mitochondrial carrier [Parathielavia hyrcaniae]|uniref:Mitochondrial carrier n=1 Tax=Parathielavia hyrcaniae TaxID=113614 RepID=A0AAN6PRL9_9PEZI|nr:mitochondrial carrier [Parathielavia hyrcaniae]
MSFPNHRSRGDNGSPPRTTATPPPSSPSPPPSDDDPLSLNLGAGTLYPGLLPAIPRADDPPLPEKPPSSNAATGASAAGVRAVTSQAVAFYFRAPVKAFFRTRVDYLTYVRALQDQQHEHHVGRRPPLSNHPILQTIPHHLTLPPPPRPLTSSPSTTLLHWLQTRLRATTPAVLASAVRHHGWRVVPDQILPPLLANVGVGAVLYTSYLQVLGRLHPDSALAARRVYPPPGPAQTFAAGFLAGAIQSVVAAPLDAVQARWDARNGAAVGGAAVTGAGNPVRDVGNGTNGNGNGRAKSVWAFSAEKMREIGVRGIFAGWGLSFLKDSFGNAVFFSVFEYLKAQGYYSFVTWYYGSLNEDAVALLSRRRPGPGNGAGGAGAGAGKAVGREDPGMPTLIRPHYAIEPAFLLLAGMGASVMQQVVLHPLSHIQAEHWERLEALDAKVRKLRREAKSGEALSKPPASYRMFRAYRDAYRVTWAECVAEAQVAGLNMRQWLYRGFWWNTIRQVPSTSAGLIIFELLRRKYGLGGEQVRINRDGYDIMLH